ncbi:hypothetical protein COT44_04050 [Candidatus Shapirobacteria bacterium CG08_land_8_20_14_0_20_39_18]|uniref:Uncharacterized protein n=1 Tax=Candidatus Shapirobacteria bacterium CG08_land_8_20_14_0_20_39_18 TaxID=1974883 RepID=A0A2M6XC81_9BACT|nr:MAG: hypothetical protein COT44_04050 [Candidatus Shapirobacteria bacterium CG08_land_8_20_14_0_20_39_18]PIY66065.1 MAG: hypothetical protein COY91_01165 [Candidatus Shapirobacteria bacterium CG_4_10_14_0_8_um_filter_39_15]PJE68251.1 MAG: hypothetical protein COU94_02895 [Candidatus Shapirobacteria bacterium CG10_big_fil_rev_8_21_14_0_10_38_8]
MPNPLPQAFLNQIKQTAQDSVETVKQTVDSGMEQIGLQTRPLSQAKLLFPDQYGQPTDGLPQKEKNDFKRMVEIGQLQKKLNAEIANAQQQRTKELQQRREPPKQTPQIKEMTPTIETSAPQKGKPGANNRKVEAAKKQSQPETSGQRQSG